MAKKTPLPTSEFANNHRGRMKILLAMKYKGNRVYVRMIGDDMFLWDAVYKDELYSSYIIITPKKGEKLTQDQIAQATEMCYAGAAATIDLQMGSKLSKKMKQVVRTFEKSKRNLEKLTN